jgi:hypothetical protein
MLRVTLDVNGKVIGTLTIICDKNCTGRTRNYTVKHQGADAPPSRVEGFDAERGAWHLAAEAIKTVSPDDGLGNAKRGATCLDADSGRE